MNGAFDAVIIVSDEGTMRAIFSANLDYGTVFAGFDGEVNLMLESADVQLL